MKPSNGTYTHQGEKLCLVILKYIHQYRGYDLDRRTQACKNERMHINRCAVVETMSRTIKNQRIDSPESRLEGNGLEVFTLFCSNLLKAFKIQNNLIIRQYYVQAYF